MGKGSKARPVSVTAAEFWDNWDRIFEQEEPFLREKPHCISCGLIDESEVVEEHCTDYEPYGDRSVEVKVIYVHCERCGGGVEYNY